MRWVFAIFLFGAACDPGIDAPSSSVSLAETQSDALALEDQSGERIVRALRASGSSGAQGHPEECTRGGSTAEATSDKDARALAIALLKELDRGARISCPCKAGRGDFASERECVAALGYKESDIACVGHATAQVDEPTLRAQLACESRRARLRNDCHEAAACAEAAVNACDESQVECPPPDAEALTKVLMACPGATAFGR